MPLQARQANVFSRYLKVLQQPCRCFGILIGGGHDLHLHLVLPGQLKVRDHFFHRIHVGAFKESGSDPLVCIRWFRTIHSLIRLAAHVPIETFFQGFRGRADQFQPVHFHQLVRWTTHRNN